MQPKAARYERVSTLPQAVNGTLLETQAAENLRQVDEIGHDPDEESHWSEDASAADMTRAGYLSLQRAVRNRLVASVVVYDPDRLARDPMDILLFIRLCKQYSVELYFSCGRSVKTAEDECIEFLRGYFGFREREKIRERTNMGKRHRATQGFMPCGNPHGTYGYDKDPLTRKLVINEEEAIWVLQIYLWRLDGLSPHAIMKRLQELGVLTKTGCVWAARTVKAVLVNTVYKGEAYYGKTRQQTVNGKRILNPVPQEDWILVPDCAAAIVPPAIWDRVQETWGDTVSPVDSKLWGYFLTKHLSCGFCGSSMSGSTQKDDYRLYPYYACSNTRTRNNQSGDCTAPGIRADFLEPAVWQHVAGAVRDPSAVIEDLRSNWETGTGKLARQEARLRREIQKSRTEEKLLLRQYSREVIDEATLDELIAPVQALRSRHERDLSKLEEQAKLAAALDDADRRIRDYFEQYAARLDSVTEEERRALISRLNVRVVATKERALVTAEIDPDLFTIERTLA